MFEDNASAGEHAALLPQGASVRRPGRRPGGEARPAESSPGKRGRRGTGGAARKLTLAQARALRAMAAGAEVSLRGISWTTARALRALGLCELGPGRRGRLTGKGRAALLEEEAKAAQP
jgi:hypothetical protein